MDGHASLLTHRPRALLALVAAVAATALATLAAGAAADVPVDPAARWPTDGPALRTAVAIAQDWWGFAPCHGDVTLAWEDLDASVDAQTTWANSAGAFADPMRNTECELSLNPAGDWSWEKLCTIVVHEMGHLAGREHVDDPDDVMYYTYERPIGPCAATPDPGAAPEPAAAAEPAASPPAAQPQAKPHRGAVAARRHAARRRPARGRPARAHRHARRRTGRRRS